MATKFIGGRGLSPSPKRQSPKRSPKKSPTKATNTAPTTYLYMVRLAEEGEGQNTHTFNIRTAIFDTLEGAVNEAFRFVDKEYKDIKGHSLDQHLKSEDETRESARAELLAKITAKGRGYFSTGLDNTELIVIRLKLNGRMPNNVPAGKEDTIG